jgi:hypothetical protein
MDLADRLEPHLDALRESAVAHHRAAHEGHYEKLGETFVRERVGVLVGQVHHALQSGNPLDLLRHAETVAEQRYHEGFHIEELQSFYNAVEEAFWEHLVTHEQPQRLAESLATIGAVIGGAKERLAQVYVRLASEHHAPAIDVEKLFAGV